MKNLVLISNCVKTKTTCELALHNTNVRLTTVSNIDHVKNDSDIVLIDETFMDKDLGMLKAYCSKIKPLCSKIGIMTTQSHIDKDFVSFVVHKPFLPTTLVRILINELNSIDGFKVKLQDNSKDDLPQKRKIRYQHTATTPTINTKQEIEKRIDRNIDIKSKAINTQNLLNQNEINSIKGLLKRTIQQQSRKKNIQLNFDGLKDTDAKSILKPKDIIYLDNFAAQQLMPLFSVLDKKTINNLMEGHEILVKLKLRK